MSRRLATALLLLFAVTATPLQALQAPARSSARSVAVTIDDLPAVRITDLADLQAMTTALLAALERHGIPATGFVNESKLDAVPAERPARVATLDAWLDAGHDLGNHTYSHLRLYGASIESFQDEVLRGEVVTRQLLAARGRVPRYFRHPTLNTGADRASRTAAEGFLAARGYQVAPVTIDNDEYLYAAAYDRARARGDRALMERLGADYLRYMAEVFAHYERFARDLLGREPAQVLLLHANWLNADYLESLAAMMTGRGYRFVSLEEALRDDAYRLPDAYIGPRGPSWLERWAVTRGATAPSQPEVPAWVAAAAR